jgi:hypothetical protein
MNSGAAVVLLAAVAMANCAEPSAETRREEQPPSPAVPAPPQTERTTTQPPVVRDPESAGSVPQPLLTPEERERLLRGTKRREPSEH